jgi:predicted nucleic acid-binding protein
MKLCLADVNMLLRLLVRHHEHHKLTPHSFDNLAAGEVALAASCSWRWSDCLAIGPLWESTPSPRRSPGDLIAQLLEDERVEFVPEPALLDDIFPKLLRYPVPTSKLVGDAYLAAFSIAGQIRMVTWIRASHSSAASTANCSPLEKATRESAKRRTA